MENPIAAHSSAGPRHISIDSWSDAFNRGNTLLYFPREIRDMIYEEVISEAPNFSLRSLDKSLAGTSRQMRKEFLPLFIRAKKWDISDIFRTHYWLSRALPKAEAYQHVRSMHLPMVLLRKTLRYEDPAAMYLALSCPNLTHLSLTFAVDDIVGKDWQIFVGGKVTASFDSSDLGTNLKKFLGCKNLKTLTLIADLQYPCSSMRTCRMRRLSPFFSLKDWFIAEYQKIQMDVVVEWIYDHPCRFARNNYGFRR